MRVLQLIDSLHTGGAERVAVNMANSLANHDVESYLCVTRDEGLLKDSVSNKVNYFFLNKKRTVDYAVIKRLLSYVKNEQIAIIHAHSSSFFLATILKVFGGNIKIVWHDHYGKSQFLDKRKHRILKFCSNYFSHIFSVNEQLETWSKTKLSCDSVSYLPNFVVKNNNKKETHLNGVLGKRILCLANLRPQKDHENLLRAFERLQSKFREWTLHCVGKDFNDDYSKHIFKLIEEFKLKEKVFFYGSVQDVEYVIEQSNIGVLSSNSEGLPLALLEYGLGSLAVVATDVGDCSKVISNSNLGKLVQKNDHLALSDALSLYMEDNTLRTHAGEALHQHIKNTFSVDSQIKKVVSIYTKVLEVS